MVLTVIGAVGFACKGVFAKYLYADGWSVDSVVLVRALVALPCLVLWTVLMQGATALVPRNLNAVLWTAFGGICCYYFGTVWDFQALMLIDASVERVLLFAYPSIVVLIDAVLKRKMPSRALMGALLVTYAGILMVVTGLNFSILHGNLIGGGLVLACAFGSAIYYVTGDRWAPSMGSAAFTVYALGAATACLVADHALRRTPWQLHWSPRDILLFGGLVLFATVVPMLAMAEGVRRLGAPRASVVSTVGPPSTVLLGAWLFGERFTLTQWLGVGLIVSGILLLEALRRAANRRQGQVQTATASR